MENVWDYPRPPRVEPVSQPLRVMIHGQVLAQTRRALRVLETSHPPAYYLPPGDIDRERLRPSGLTSFCEYKGRASYWSWVGPEGRIENLAWSYPDPSEGYEALAGYLSFYPGRTGGCFVGDERVRAQEGGFYGGWITADLIGPFKGGEGTAGW